MSFLLPLRHPQSYLGALPRSSGSSTGQVRISLLYSLGCGVLLIDSSEYQSHPPVEYWVSVYRTNLLQPLSVVASDTMEATVDPGASMVEAEKMVGMVHKNNTKKTQLTTNFWRVT
jgi:hypothetical protein